MDSPKGWLLVDPPVFVLGKLPACAEMCSTKALLGGDGDVIADIYRERVARRGNKGAEAWGWGSAYGQPPKGKS